MRLSLRRKKAEGSAGALCGLVLCVAFVLVVGNVAYVLFASDAAQGAVTSHLGAAPHTRFVKLADAPVSVAASISGGADDGGDLADTCENSVIGRHYNVDRNGYLCAHAAFNFTSRCCVTGPVDEGVEKEALSTRFHCGACNKAVMCCSVYEFCVSCCLGHTRTAAQLQLQPADRFLHCTQKCRTSSASVVHENLYRSSLKFCYGSQLPPLAVA